MGYTYLLKDTLTNVIVSINNSSTGDTLQMISNKFNLVTTSLSKTEPIINDSTFWGIPIDIARVLIPSLTTILVFALGIIINNFLKKWEKRKEIMSLKNTILTWLDLIKAPIQQQSTACEDFSQNLLNVEDMLPVRFEYNQLLADKLEEIQLKELINTFIINSKGVEGDNAKNIYNLVGQISYFVHLEKELPEYYKIYHKQTYEIMEEWNKNFKDLDGIRSAYFVQILSNPQHPSYNYAVQYSQISNNYIRNSGQNGSTAQNTESALINPLENITNAQLKINPQDEFAFLTVAKLQDLRIALKKWRVNNNGNSELFLGISKRMNEVYNILASVNSKFKSTKLKHFYRIK